MPPTPNQPPRCAQGRMLLGPAALRPCPFASLLGHVRARLGPGGYYRRSGNGGPQTCLPAACGVAQRGPGMAHLHQHKLKTLARGQASRGERQEASSCMASSGWLTRRQRDQGGVPREVPMTQAMTTKGARRAPSRAVSFFPLWCKGSKRRREHQTKASISVQRDKDQPNGRGEVTVDPKQASPPEPLTGEVQL